MEERKEWDKALFAAPFLGGLLFSIFSGNFILQIYQNVVLGMSGMEILVGASVQSNIVSAMRSLSIGFVGITVIVFAVLAKRPPERRKTPARVMQVILIVFQAAYVVVLLFFWKNLYSLFLTEPSVFDSAYHYHTLPFTLMFAGFSLVAILLAMLSTRHTLKYILLVQALPAALSFAAALMTTVFSREVYGSVDIVSFFAIFWLPDAIFQPFAWLFPCLFMLSDRKRPEVTFLQRMKARSAARQQAKVSQAVAQAAQAYQTYQPYQAQPQAQQQPTFQPAPDLAAELKRLQGLVESGAITLEEYEALRQKLFGGPSAPGQ